MRLIQDNKSEAFEILYQRYKTPLYSYLTSQLNQSLAEEMLQDVFMKLLEGRMSFRFESKVKTWVWAIARNKVIDHWRSAGKKMDDLLVPDLIEEGEEFLESRDEHLEEALIKRTTQKQLDECLEELSIKQKEALALQIQSGLSYDEISSLMKLTVSSVKSLIFRAKGNLLDCFKRGGHL